MAGFPSRALAWVHRTRPWLVWTRFADARGLLLARGLAFQAVLAAFAGLWMAFTILGFWLRSSTNALDALVGWINGAVPGFIDTGDGAGGAVQLDTLLKAGTLGWTGVVAGLVLLWTIVAWFSAAREAVRSVAGLPRRPGNPVLLRLWDALIALIFGAAIFLSAALSFASTGATELILGWFGISHPGAAAFFTGVAGIIVGFAIDTLLTYVFLRYLGAIGTAFRPTVEGALLGAAGFGGLKALAGLLVGGGGSNPLLTSFAVIIGLLFWFFLLCTTLLVAAAWAVEADPARAGSSPVRAAGH
ncbi:MAG: hypothetical protein BGO95_07480 [Micrococcales bacterium 73-13]|nr:MAG: hypothetical protein BGO95_07480 [Micrococcales bacterium 73-13]